MNRRTLLKRLVVLGVLAGIPAATLVGCTEDPKQLLSVIVQQLSKIIAVTEPNAPWLTSLQNVLTGLQTAITTWDATNVITDVESALNAVLGVLSVIPQTAVYAPLIAVLVAGIEVVLNLFVPATPTTMTSSSRRTNPYHGIVSVREPHMFQTRIGAYKAQWNDTARNIGLPQARI